MAIDPKNKTSSESENSSEPVEMTVYDASKNPFGSIRFDSEYDITPEPSDDDWDGHINFDH